MNTEQERQAPAKRDEHSIEQLDTDLRFLNWQISHLEKMVRTALELVKTVEFDSIHST